MDLKIDYEMAKKICNEIFIKNYSIAEYACQKCPLNTGSMFYCLKSIIRDSKGKIDIIIKDWK